MPELPEVETTRRGLQPVVTGARFAEVQVREPRLRWPVPPDLPQRLRGQCCLALQRRAKYLLLRFESGTLIVHLGMSGSLRLSSPAEALRPHDHALLALDGDPAWQLRFHDPRRFGALLWQQGDETALAAHRLLNALGPEPIALPGLLPGAVRLSTAGLGAALNRGRRAVKLALLDQTVVAGLGNIYVNEALFLARLHPGRSVASLQTDEIERLTAAIQAVLQAAIELGGTTLRDFVNSHGAPGYFQQTLQVYDRTGEPCRVCATPIARLNQGGRGSWFCPRCQPPGR